MTIPQPRLVEPWVDWVWIPLPQSRPTMDLRERLTSTDYSWDKNWLRPSGQRMLKTRLEFAPVPCPLSQSPTSPTNLRHITQIETSETSGGLMNPPTTTSPSAANRLHKARSGGRDKPNCRVVCQGGPDTVKRPLDRGSRVWGQFEIV